VGSSPLVSLTDVHKTFGTQEALRGCSVDVTAGEVVVVIGPSGSGKSTLLRCMNLLEVPDAGSISLNAEVIFDAAPGGKRMSRRQLAMASKLLRAQSAMVFQRFHLFPHLTALGNVTVGPIRARGVARPDAEREGRELLAQVGLADRADAFPSQLSGGQQQRVAIARALAMHPKLMLFDEPTSGLDPELVGEVLGVIRAVARMGMAKVIVTHEMDFAKDVGDRVVFMDGGTIVEEGTPDEVFGRPSQPRTRSFLRKLLERTGVASEPPGRMEPRAASPFPSP